MSNKKYNLLSIAIISFGIVGALKASGQTPKNVIMLPAALTDTSVTLYWQKKTGQIKGYNILENGKKLAFTTKNYFRVNKLKPATKYKFCIAAVADGGMLPESQTIDILTKPKPAVFNILNYGAVAMALP